VIGTDGLAAAVAASGWERLLADLVRTPSHPGIARQEERVAGARGLARATVSKRRSTRPRPAALT
jgi:hypothetical protein